MENIIINILECKNMSELNVILENIQLEEAKNCIREIYNIISGIYDYINITLCK